MVLAVDAKEGRDGGQKRILLITKEWYRHPCLVTTIYFIGSCDETLLLRVRNVPGHDIKLLWLSVQYVSAHPLVQGEDKLRKGIFWFFNFFMTHPCSTVNRSSDFFLILFHFFLCGQRRTADGFATTAATSRNGFLRKKPHIVSLISYIIVSPWHGEIVWRCRKVETLVFCPGEVVDSRYFSRPVY